jgi:hypothetical protein
MERLSVWVSAGLLSAGVSAAVLAGAGVAAADDSPSGGEGGGSAASPGPGSAGGTSPGTVPDTKPDPEPDTVKPDVPAADAPEIADTADTAAETPKKKKKHATTRSAAASALKEQSSPVDAGALESAVAVKPAPVAAPSATTPTETLPTIKTPAVTDIGSGGDVAERISRHRTVSLALAAPEAAATVQAAAAPVPSLIRWVQGLASSIVNGIGSLAFNSLQALEALVTGPPALPPNSTVTVRSSTILLSTGQRVKANWYYPDGDVLPEKLIVLQHGFFALGPMYSYTAANLAASTGSIVVTPTISSNPFAGDDSWINGDGLASAIADLFVGDRRALTDSALAAGFGTRYGLDPATATLPEKFGLAGHSAGAGLVTGVAGYLVDKNAANDLVGVITLDGVPLGYTAAVALRKLQAYEDATGRYIPVREIGAPPSAFNSTSTLRADLNAARPGRFNGVVLSGGVHMDSMRGGNPIVQFVAYLAAGFPKPQNQAAVSLLSTTWFNDWFLFDTDNGDLELVPGSTIPITTPQGTAQGVVIGSAVVPASRFVTIAV